jgi:hypothetical protein
VDGHRVEERGELGRDVLRERLPGVDAEQDAKVLAGLDQVAAPRLIHCGGEAAIAQPLPYRRRFAEVVVALREVQGIDEFLDESEAAGGRLSFRRWFIHGRYPRVIVTAIIA